VDNARLTKMLASTGLFKEFLEYVQDSNGAAYIPVGFRDEDLEGSMVTFGEVSRQICHSINLYYAEQECGSERGVEVLGTSRCI
jgi:hypothetical protein